MSNYIKQNFENDQVLKAEQLNYIEKGIERAAKGTSSLSPSLTLENSLVSCSPLENSLLEVTSCIEAAQEGSGSPYPAGRGKNLLPYPYQVPEGNHTSSNINFEVRKDGSILVKAGTAGDSPANLILTKTFNFIAGKTYYLSDKKGAVWIICKYKDESGEDRYAPSSFTWQENYTLIYLYLQVYENQTVSSDTIIYPALYVDKKEDIWTPYSNIRPITGWDGATLTRCGKNLLCFDNFSHTLNGNQTTISGDILTSTFVNGSLTVLETKLHMPGTYTLTILPTDSFAAAVFFYTENRAETLAARYIQQRNTPYVVTVTLDKPFIIGIGGLVGNYGTYSYRVQLECGAATAYEPYQGDAYTTQFPETIYGGELDWNTGVLTVTHEKIVFDGTEDWKGNYSTRANQVYVKNIASNAREHGMCSHFNYKYGAAYSVPIWESIEVRGSTTWAYSTLSDTIENWKAYLAAQHEAETPVTVVYELAEPHTIQLTPQQIETLKGTNNLFSTTGKTKVTFQTDLIQTLNNQTLDLNDLGARIARLETALVNTL